MQIRQRVKGRVLIIGEGRRVTVDGRILSQQEAERIIHQAEGAAGGIFRHIIVLLSTKKDEEYEPYIFPLTQ